jgi:predicted regulator of amino acid metabolism with ACT domain
MGWGVVEIIPQDASMPGILSNVSSIIAKEQISIRQAIVDDYQLSEEPKLFIVTEKTLPGRLLTQLRGAQGVKGVATY